MVERRYLGVWGGVIWGNAVPNSVLQTFVWAEGAVSWAEPGAIKQLEPWHGVER